MTKKQIIETKIYEFLGVKLFKKAVFKLEKIIHRKDKGQNINYHIKNSNSRESVNSFRKYLYYNGFIHIKNIVLGILTIIFIIIFRTNPLIIILLSLLLIKDAYCVMLQRYNWLKLNTFEERLKIREERKIDKKTSQINKEQLIEKINNKKISKKELLEEIQRMRNYLINIQNDNNILSNSISDITDIVKEERNIKKKVLRKEEK